MNNVQRKSPFAADVEGFLQTILTHNQSLQNQINALEGNCNTYVSRANACIQELRRLNRHDEANRLIQNSIRMVSNFKSVQYALFDAMTRESRVAQVLADELQGKATTVPEFAGKAKQQPPQANQPQAPAQPAPQEKTNGQHAAAVPAPEATFKPAPPIQEAAPKVESPLPETEKPAVTQPLLRGTGGQA